MFLSKKDLEKRQRDIFLFPHPISNNLDKLVDTVSYELRVGREAFLSGKNELVDLEKQGYVVIEPGMFASILTYEYRLNYQFCYC
jgi:deoxycytidine triphosphate deaminase